MSVADDRALLRELVPDLACAGAHGLEAALVRILDRELALSSGLGGGEDRRREALARVDKAEREVGQVFEHPRIRFAIEHLAEAVRLLARIDT